MSQVQILTWTSYQIMESRFGEKWGDNLPHVGDSWIRFFPFFLKFKAG